MIIDTFINNKFVEDVATNTKADGLTASACKKFLSSINFLIYIFLIKRLFVGSLPKQKDCKVLCVSN